MIFRMSIPSSPSNNSKLSSKFWILLKILITDFLIKSESSTTRILFFGVLFVFSSDVKSESHESGKFEALIVSSGILSNKLLLGLFYQMVCQN